MSDTQQPTDISTAEWPTFPPRGSAARRKPLPDIIGRLEPLLGTGQCLRVMLPGRDAKEVTKQQGRLNSLGRRSDVPFSIETGRKLEDDIPVLYVRPVPKRPRKGK